MKLALESTKRLGQSQEKKEQVCNQFFYTIHFNKPTEKISSGNHIQQSRSAFRSTHQRGIFLWGQIHGLECPPFLTHERDFLAYQAGRSQEGLGFRQACCVVPVGPSDVLRV